MLGQVGKAELEELKAPVIAHAVKMMSMMTVPIGSGPQPTYIPIRISNFNEPYHADPVHDSRHCMATSIAR
jgi:hypothetical protein